MSHSIKYMQFETEDPEKQRGAAFDLLVTVDRLELFKETEEIRVVITHPDSGRGSPHIKLSLPSDEVVEFYWEYDDPKLPDWVEEVIPCLFEESWVLLNELMDAAKADPFTVYGAEYKRDVNIGSVQVRKTEQLKVML